MEMTNKKR